MFLVRVESGLWREAREHPLPARLLAAGPRRRGRPRREYVPQVGSRKDVDVLRRRRVPIYLLTDDQVSAIGYPVRFRPWLAVPEGLSGKIRTEFRILPVRDADALRQPGIVELVVLLLRFDPIAARVVAVRNRRSLNPHELYRRVRNEGLEAAATRVRLDEFSAALPRVGERLPLRELRWIERNNPPIPTG